LAFAVSKRLSLLFALGMTHVPFLLLLLTLKVAENVLVLNELFKDMANLVQEQQQSIDTIETNVESAAERTKAGITHLEAAIEHQKSCAIM